MSSQTRPPRVDELSFPQSIYCNNDHYKTVKCKCSNDGNGASINHIQRHKRRPTHIKAYAGID